MTMQSNPQNAGFLHSAGGQSILMIAALAVIVTLAWFYVF